MNQHEKINYLEFPAKNIAATKAFYSEVFGWAFEDYGPEYTAFSNAGIEGGFYQSELVASAENGSALTVFYSSDLENTLNKITAAGGGLLKKSSNFPVVDDFIFLIPVAMNLRFGPIKAFKLSLICIDLERYLAK